MANPVRLHSNFLQATAAGHLAMAELIHKATDVMEETAKKRLDASASRRGYKLTGEDISKEVSPREGRIEYNQWYGLFFEYGTVYIQAMPFMRPGHRAGRKVIKNEGIARAIFASWMRKKVRR